MTNAYYSSPTDIEPLTRARSVDINAIDIAVDVAFDKMPTETNLKSGTVNYAVDTGTANSYVVSLPHAPASYTDGLLVSFRALNANTGAASINVNALGAKSIRKTDGTALGAGEITAGSPIDLRYSTATGFFHMAPNSSVAATNAANSASQAATSATNAATSASEAAASFDAFDDRFLGAKASDPTLDNDGAALLTGALYFNTTANEMRVWSGSAWLAAYLPATGYATLTGTETLTNKTLTAPTVNGYTEGVDAPAAGSSFTISLTSDTVHGISTNGNATVTLPAPSAGKSFQLQITYGGAHSITWAVTGGSTIGWPGGTVPTPTSTNGKIDVFNFTCNASGSRWLGSVFGQNF